MRDFEEIQNFLSFLSHGGRDFVIRPDADAAEKAGVIVLISLLIIISFRVSLALFHWHVCSKKIIITVLAIVFPLTSSAYALYLFMNPDIVNINGGAIALGHPLGCTGCKLTIQNLHDMKRLNKKYGMITACVGGGQGIAGIIENIN